MRTTRYAVCLAAVLAAGPLLTGCSSIGSGSAADKVTAHPSWWTSAGSTTAAPTTPATPSTSASTPPASTSSSSSRTTQPPRTSSTSSSSPPSRTSSAASGHLRIVSGYIAFPQSRKDQTAAYDQRHYGTRTWHLSPSMIVLHFTGSSSYSGALNTFASNAPNLGESPGTCAHYIVGQDGTVHAIVPTTIVCRHTIGLNDKAIGIEMVQSGTGTSGHSSDQQILDRPAQIGAVLALVRMLQKQYGIPTGNVIGHAMANAAPQFHDLEGWHNDHVDWGAQDVAVLRSRL